VMGKPDTREYLLGAGTSKIFHPRIGSQVGKGRWHGYSHGRVNALPALTRPVAIPSNKGHLAQDCWSPRRHSEGNVATMKEVSLSTCPSEEEWDAEGGFSMEVSK
jgi:hypothetical protein